MSAAAIDHGKRLVACVCLYCSLRFTKKYKCKSNNVQTVQIELQRKNYGLCWKEIFWPRRPPREMCRTQCWKSIELIEQFSFALSGDILLESQQIHTHTQNKRNKQNIEKNDPRRPVHSHIVSIFCVLSLIFFIVLLLIDAFASMTEYGYVFVLCVCVFPMHISNTDK